MIITIPCSPLLHRRCYSSPGCSASGLTRHLPSKEAVTTVTPVRSGYLAAGRRAPARYSSSRLHPEIMPHSLRIVLAAPRGRNGLRRLLEIPAARQPRPSSTGKAKTAATKTRPLCRPRPLHNDPKETRCETSFWRAYSDRRLLVFPSTPIGSIDHASTALLLIVLAATSSAILLVPRLVPPETPAPVIIHSQGPTITTLEKLSQLVREGKLQKIYGLVSDISLRKRAEEEQETEQIILLNLTIPRTGLYQLFFMILEHRLPITARIHGFAFKRLRFERTRAKAVC